jgi:hypothetical protein
VAVIIIVLVEGRSSLALDFNYRILVVAVDQNLDSIIHTHILSLEVQNFNSNYRSLVVRRNLDFVDRNLVDILVELDHIQVDRFLVLLVSIVDIAMGNSEGIIIDWGFIVNGGTLSLGTAQRDRNIDLVLQQLVVEWLDLKVLMRLLVQGVA